MFSDIGNGYVDIVSGGKLLIINGHELLITTTESSDSGVYRCNASNSQGSEIATARLTVFGKNVLMIIATLLQLAALVQCLQPLDH